jgi:ABC-2 type transport system permease protein
MITIIARKEFAELLREGRFRWAAGIILALLAVAALAGAHYQRDLVAQQLTAQSAEQSRWYNQGAKNPHSAAHYGLYAFKPRLAPAFLDPGVEPYTGVATWIEAHKQNEMLFRPAQDATLAQRFGDLTVALVFQVMLPLVVVLLAFNAFAGERERGTLRQLLSLGLRARDLVLGKALGLSFALSLIVLPALLLGGVALALTGPAAGVARIAPLFLIYVLYLGIFLLLSLAVSARAPTTRSSLVILLGFWAVNCLVAPRAFGALAAKAHPLSDPIASKARMKEELGDPHGAPTKLQEVVARLMKQHGVTRPDDLPVNVRGIQLQVGEEHGYEIFDRYYGERFATMEAQNQVVQRGAALFPLLGVQALSMALAGTDLGQHRDFVRAAEDYRRVVQKMMNDEITARPLKPGEVHLGDKALWTKVPAFSYTPPGALDVLRQNALPLSLLVLWLAGTCWVALRGAAALRPI